MDVYGDHALHCGSGRLASHVYRHHLVRDALAAIARDVHQPVTSEPSFPFAAGGGEERRADLLLRQWDGVLDCYLDVTGASPLTVSRLSDFSPGGAALGAAAAKVVSYTALLQAHGGRLSVVPFAFETLGGLASQAVALLQRLQFAVHDTSLVSEHVSSYSVFGRISFAIASGVGSCLAARLRLV
jgi:hypothetical protein